MKELSEAVVGGYLLLDTVTSHSGLLQEEAAAGWQRFQLNEFLQIHLEKLQSDSEKEAKLKRGFSCDKKRKLLLACKRTCEITQQNFGKHLYIFPFSDQPKMILTEAFQDGSAKWFLLLFRVILELQQLLWLAARWTILNPILKPICSLGGAAQSSAWL